MIRGLVDFALNNRFVVLAVGLLLAGWGAISFHNLPVEAYPDIADNYVTVITQWPGRAAEEVEQQVTIPIEIQMNGIPHLSHLRSESIFGLSFVLVIFDDSSDNDWNRQKVTERLTQADLPSGVSPSMGTDWSLTGQIYWYTLRSTNPTIDLMDLRSIQDWTIVKALKSVPDIVDVSTFGGTTREYQVRVDPDKLVSYGLSIGQLEDQLAKNNINGGGNFIETGLQQMNVARFDTQHVEDIRQPADDEARTPLRVSDLAVVEGKRFASATRAVQTAARTARSSTTRTRFAQVMMRKARTRGRRWRAYTRRLPAQRPHPAAGREDRTMIDRRPLSLRWDGRAQSGRRDDPGGDRPVPVPAERTRGLIVALTIPFALLFASSGSTSRRSRSTCCRSARWTSAWSWTAPSYDR